jgi:hypothetical protein
LVDELARCLPNEEVVTMPDATYDGPIMSAEAVNAEIIEFLSTHWAQRPDQVDWRRMIGHPG